VKQILIGVIWLYRSVLSPVMRCLFGTSGACRYTPTCSCYALEALQNHGTLRGVYLTVRRLLRCHPWGGTGFDPVPRNQIPNPNPAPNLPVLPGTPTP
jgi:uncharacterized protein